MTPNNQLIAEAAAFNMLPQTNQTLNQAKLLIASLLEALKASEWQSAESAPKDGKEFIGLNEEGKIILVRWDKQIQSEFVEKLNGLYEKQYNDRGSWKTGWGFSWHYVKLTKWQPLPPTPRED